MQTVDSLEKQKLVEMLLARKGITLPEADSISRRPARGSCCLSFAQQRLWLLDRLQPDSASYNLHATIRMAGPLKVQALEYAFNQIIKRHDVLRTSFKVLDGQPVQVISADPKWRLTIADLTQLDLREQESVVLSEATEEARRPFDLGSAPLIRVNLIRLSEQHHVLLLTMHHIVSDAWSLGILTRELMALYQECLEVKPSGLPELPIQYADYAQWQRQRISSGKLQAQLDYWREQLAGAPPILNIRMSRPHPMVQTFSGAVQSFTMPQTTLEELRSLSRANDVTLFMTLLAAFNVLLCYHSEQKDVVVGTPIANRNRVETRDLIGFFINTLVMRSDLRSDPTFEELVARVRNVSLGAFANQDVPFETLVDELQPERNPGYNPLFQVWFVLQNAPAKPLKLPEVSLSRINIESGMVRHDLALGLIEGSEGLGGSIQYKTDLFDGDAIELMIDQFQMLITSIVECPSLKLSVLIERLAENERQWRTTKSEALEEASLARLKTSRRRVVTSPLHSNYAAEI